ncbi:hypothetical protein HanIR_Chr14g0685531 [Helianthus annuus]|nr:hypothetical protein HanIR_Chr14g0685531 [Helianthus annuus]
MICSSVRVQSQQSPPGTDNGKTLPYSGPLLLIKSALACSLNSAFRKHNIFISRRGQVH